MLPDSSYYQYRQSRSPSLLNLCAGKSTLGLAYGLSAAETVIAPAMPSTTARAGGIFMPIISSLAQQSGSKPSALRVCVGE